MDALVFATSLSQHSSGNLVLYPYGTKPLQQDTPVLILQVLTCLPPSQQWLAALCIGCKSMSLL